MHAATVPRVPARHAQRTLSIYSRIDAIPPAFCIAESLQFLIATTAALSPLDYKPIFMSIYVM
jgi:hypothetical protein